MANILKTEGIVLNTWDFKESSLICSVMTRKFGKIRLLAKGARRPKSKFCGELEPFSLDEIIFYKKEHKDLYTLSDTMLLEFFAGIRSSIAKVNAALVLCEFFDKTLPAEESDENAYRMMLSYLKALGLENENSIKRLVLCTLALALEPSGVKPELSGCVRCKQPLSHTDKRVNFSLSAGGLVCDQHFDDTVMVLKEKTVTALGQVYEGKPAVINDDMILEIERFLTDYIYYHLHGIALNSLKHLK